jgi:dipeptidase E
VRKEAGALLVGAAMSCICATGCGNPDWRDLLPSLRRETVYVAVSAGTMVVTPNFGEAYDDWFCREPPASDRPSGDARALGLVDFSLFPNLDHERSPQNSLANAERWAAGIPVPTYAIDDQSAIKVTDGAVEVVTEGLETVHPLGPMACASVRQCC